MNAFASALAKLGLIRQDVDVHLVRVSLVILFFFFGYQKWFEYEAQYLIPYISNGPLVSWLYTVFGIRGATWFLGVAEWTFGGLLLLGFWSRKLGMLGAAGSVIAFVSTVTIIPFMPNGWAQSAGGFPAMTGSVAFLMKDVVLLAASIYLLRQDMLHVLLMSVINLTPEPGIRADRDPISARASLSVGQPPFGLTDWTRDRIVAFWRTFR